MAVRILLLLVLLSQADGEDLNYPDNPDVVYSVKNRNVTIPCDLDFPEGEQLQMFMWHHNKDLITYKSQDGQIKFSYPQLKEIYNIGGNNTLEVADVGVSEAGNYTCKKMLLETQSDGGIKMVEQTATKELIVQDVPSPPGLPEVTAISSRNATVSWQRSIYENNSPITNYIINVKTNDQDWQKSRALLVNEKTTSIIVRDLLPHTAYQIQVIAKNAIGNSTPSSPSSIFITRPEVPSSPPLNFRAVSPESSKIKIMWEPPPADHINGMLEGYQIQYGITGDPAVFAVSIEDRDRKEALIEMLKPYSPYTITIQAVNEEGMGPAAWVEIRTAQGVPDKPRITHYSEMQSRSIVVHWEAPLNENGLLKNYQLQWIHNNTYKTRIITGHLTNPMSAHITGLEPYTQYNLRVRAETGGGYSEYSNLLSAVTDVEGPSSPEILNVTVLSTTSIYLQWRRPKIVFRKLDMYVIRFRSLSGEIFGERQVNGDEVEKVLVDIPTNNAYFLKIAGSSKSIFSQDYYDGNFSKEVEFELEDPNVGMSSRSEVVSKGAVAGILVGVLLVLVIVIIFVGYKSVTCRKYYHHAFRYFAVPTNSQSPPSTVVFPPEVIEETKYPDIRVCDFLNHVRALHADSDNGFSNEFEDITSQTRTDLMAEGSYLPENKAKNRYVNISAFDHTRVLLQPVVGKPRSSDYINANYIDGYKKPRAYIATQGPLPNTFADFWRMIWEQGSIVIIMITNLMERGRRKCDMYWPEEGSETYGHVTVKHINTFSRAHYTVRMFSLKNSKNRKKHVYERIVYQYHYTEWPDHGVPDFTLPVLKFILKSVSESPPGAGPIVIHCSAGVGRTGTYMLIDTMIKQIKDKGTVNVPAFLLHIRKQRNFLVQTEEQYMLIHDAIAEYILTQGDTEVKDYDIGRTIENLTHQIDGEPTPLDVQYTLATSFSPKADDMFHALKSVNLAKNRDLDLIPLSVKRVLLPMQPGVDGSDYINATYLQGFHKSHEFIVTQHPLEQTMEDFWRMVWDQNSSVIVMLSDVDEDDFRSFWPEKGNPISVDTGNFKLTYREDEERKKYVIRDFLLESTQDDYILMTRIIAPNMKWPESCQPAGTVFEMIDTVQELHKQNDIGPVIVVDRFGGVEAATFCALWTLYDQLQYDKAINVYMLTKLYHLKRPGIIGSKENYLFLYQATESLHKEWIEREKQSSPGSIRLHLGSIKKNGTLPRSVTINSKIETDV